MNALALIKLVASLLPTLISLVQSVEQAIPEPGKGTEKLSLLKNILTSIDGTLTPAWPAIESVVGAIVAMFNNIGTFTKPKA